MRKQLEKILNPSAMAIIGASTQQGTVGYGIMRNMLDAGYKGILYPVNLRHQAVLGVPAYSNISAVPVTVDLAVICTPAPTVPGIVEECGQAGVGGLVIISGGFAETGPQGAAMQEAIRQSARKYQMRIIGPNCLGFINPHLGINACFAARNALPGKLALISQSAAMLTSILDWSVVQSVGFSQIVSLGGMMDIDMADLIDYFGMDAQTSCILIYLEGLRDAHRFMSAARAFARNKPIIVLKAGRSRAGAQATFSHTASLAGEDAVYDAAFQRAGIIRVDTVAQLFHMAQAVAMQPLPRSNRLAIITNAGGPGILATDYLVQYGGVLSQLTEKTLEYLDSKLPECWSKRNPVDMLEAADRDRYTEALKACLRDGTVDGVLVILTPQSLNDPADVARGVVDIARRTHKPVIASWMGEADVTEGREILEAGSVPNYRYPESAVDVFLRMYRYQRDLELLYETPSAVPADFQAEHDKALALIQGVLADGRTVCREDEAKSLLQYYGIQVGENKICSTLEEAVSFAEEIGFPVVLKISSADIPHKTESGGVKLNIWSPDQVRSAFQQIMDNVRAFDPQAQIDGILVERMVRKGFELLIGAQKDPVFGPAVIFGQGGVAAEVFQDTRMGLPPLNMALAMRIIRDTKIYPLLQGYRGIPGVSLDDLAFSLCKFSYLLMDFPQIKEVDINPYVLDEKGGLALDARIMLDTKAQESSRGRYQHLAIAPYPGQRYSRVVQVKGGRKVLLRPIRPEDEPDLTRMLEGVSNDSLYMRFFGYVPKITHNWMTRFTHIDYDREIAIVAETEEQGKQALMGVVRIIEDAWGETAEYSILVADQWQGLGLGNILTDYIIEIAQDRGIKKVVASVLPGNGPMVHMFERRGFTIDRSDMEIYEVQLAL